MYDFLRTVDLFTELSDSDLRSLSQDIFELHLSTGEDSPPQDAPPFQLTPPMVQRPVPGLSRFLQAP